MKSRSKVIQTTLSSEEHAILVDYASQNNLSIKKVARIAILNLLKSDKIDKDDPYFDLVVESLHKNERGSQEVDEIIYNQD